MTNAYAEGTPRFALRDLFQPEIASDLRAQRRVREWIAALRRGDHPQDGGYLRTQGGFCCLGVACDLFNDRIWRQSPTGWSYLGVLIDLPKPVMDAYRLRRPDGQYTGEDGYAACLAGDNDSGKSFAEIAELIEAELEAALAAGREAGRGARSPAASTRSRPGWPPPPTARTATCAGRSRRSTTCASTWPCSGTSRSPLKRSAGRWRTPSPAASSAAAASTRTRSRS